MINPEAIVIEDSDDDSDDEDKRTIFCGNLSDQVTEELLFELFLQAGPITYIKIPKESDGKRQKSFGFITYKHKCTVPYALKLYEGVKLFHRVLTVRQRLKNAVQNPFFAAGSSIELSAKNDHYIDYISKRDDDNKKDNDFLSSNHRKYDRHNNKPYQRPQHYMDNNRNRHDSRHQNRHADQRRRR